MTLQKLLFRLARAAIEEQFGRPFSFSKEILSAQFPRLADKVATFVTVNIDGDSLRGCIGSLVPRNALFDDVVANARAAAFNDSRFLPLSEGEYPYCSIEISLLSRIKEISYTDTEELRGKIRPGIDGVLLQQGKQSATFLPQVWDEFNGFDLFFSQLGIKAGLGSSPLEGHPRIFTYQVERFEDVALEDNYVPFQEAVPAEQEKRAGVEEGDIAAEEEPVAAEPTVFATPEDAEVGFYSALSNSDLDAMLAVWADDEAIVCVHPGGERLQGRDAVAESWRQMFAAPQQEMRFELEDARFVKDDLLSIHTLRERIVVNGQTAGVAIATNVYQLVDGSWRLLLHHASPDPAV